MWFSSNSRPFKLRIVVLLDNQSAYNDRARLLKLGSWYGDNQRQVMHSDAHALRRAAPRDREEEDGFQLYKIMMQMSIVKITSDIQGK